MFQKLEEMIKPIDKRIETIQNEKDNLDAYAIKAGDISN